MTREPFAKFYLDTYVTSKLHIQNLLQLVVLWDTTELKEKQSGYFWLEGQGNECASFRFLICQLNAEDSKALEMGRDIRWKMPQSLNECLGGSLPTRDTCYI